MQENSDLGVLSKRVAGLKPSGIRKFFDIAATMKNVISLGVGEPDFTSGADAFGESGRKIGSAASEK